MSGKFVIKKERTRYRFELLDETGEVVFKGSVNTTKAAVERQLKLIAEFGDDLPNHFQAVEGRIGNTWVIRGEEHSAREGEQGRVATPSPWASACWWATRKRSLATKVRHRAPQQRVPLWKTRRASSDAWGRAACADAPPAGRAVRK